MIYDWLLFRIESNWFKNQINNNCYNWNKHAMIFCMLILMIFLICCLFLTLFFVVVLTNSLNYDDGWNLITAIISFVVVVVSITTTIVVVVVCPQFTDWKLWFRWYFEKTPTWERDYRWIPKIRWSTQGSETLRGSSETASALTFLLFQ